MKGTSQPHEFQSKGLLLDRWICMKYEFVRFLRRTKALLGQSGERATIKCRVSDRRAKEIVLQERLAVSDGKPSWFYSAYDRGGKDPLTNFTLDYIENNIQKEARILVTGCGTGITAFHFAECGFREVVGIDILPMAIKVADRIKAEGNYSQTHFFVDDCFSPKLDGMFDVITALHWVFSAWMGNYGNKTKTDSPQDPNVREKLLENLLEAYSPHLNRNGVMIIELTDAVADYRLAGDHPLGEYSLNIYPVRHTPQQVAKCAEASGLTVIDFKLCMTYGHQPRTAYFLKKL